MKTCLTIAGSDPSGGAGIQADLKTFAANGVYGMSVITALTAQNTTGVRDIYKIPADFIREQMGSVFEDIPPDAVKIGMQGDAEGIGVIAETLKRYKAENPVMVATSGDMLLGDESYKALCEELLPMADIITPNIPEAERLSGMMIISHKGMLEAARILTRNFGCAVLIKGGHAQYCDSYTEVGETGNDADRKNTSTDLLLSPGEKPLYFYAERVDNPNTHGTGCTLSSAIAAHLAKGEEMSIAVRNAKKYVTGAIRAGLDLGKGRGPLDHIYKQDSAH